VLNTHLRKTRTPLLIILTLIALLTAACGTNGEDDTDALPTEASLPEAATEVVMDAEDVTEAIEDPEEFMEGTTEFEELLEEQQQQQERDTVDAEDATEPLEDPGEFLEGTTEFEALLEQQDDEAGDLPFAAPQTTADPEATVSLPSSLPPIGDTDGDGPGGFPGGMPSTGPGGPAGASQAVTDFSDLSTGETVTLSGTLALVEDGDEDTVAVIEDEAGNQVRLAMILPPSGVSAGDPVEVTGLIETAEDGGLAVRGVLTQAGEQTTASGGPPTGDTPFGQSMQQIGVTLDENLTALEGYDALTEAISDDLEGLDWVGVTGSRGQGWTYSFVDDEDLRTDYIVSPDGTVQQRTRQPLLGLEQALVTTPIDREAVVVDSDDVEAAAGDASGPFGVAMNLTTNDDDQPTWIVTNTAIDPIDATEPISEQ
jgi:hypothetical protein